MNQQIEVKENAGEIKIKCCNCGEKFPQDEIIEVSNDNYCEFCLSENSLIKECSDCGEYHIKTDMVTHDGEYYCQDCFDENFFLCNNCNEFYNIDEQCYNQNDESFCDCCFDEIYTRCNHCEEIIEREGSYTYFDNEGYAYCSDCFNEYFFTCNSCGNIYDADESYYSEYDDCYYCEDCYHDSNNNFKDYADNLINIDTLKLKDSFNTFGVEIEAYPKDSDADILNDYSELIKHFRIVEDGSLEEGGIEFVSVPLPIEKGLKLIHDFSHKFGIENLTVNKECGLHIHYFYHKNLINRDNIKKLLIAYMKLEKLFFSMVSPSRRSNTYCHSLSMEFSQSQVNNCNTLNEVLSLYYDEEVAYPEYIPKEKYNSKRYYWINLNSIMFRNTLEIRLHGGTVNSKKINYWYMIHKKLLTWIIKHSYNDIENLTEKQFLNDIMDSKLRKYIFNRIAFFNEDSLKDSLIDTPLINWFNFDRILMLESIEETKIRINNELLDAIDNRYNHGDYWINEYGNLIPSTWELNCIFGHESSIINMVG